MNKLSSNSLKFVIIGALLGLFTSCTHVESPKRDVASQTCWEQVKPEYHSYFDSVEKCIENKQVK